MSSRGKLQDSFDLSWPMPQKSADEITIEKIVAADMREKASTGSAEPEPPGRAAVRDEMRRRILAQKRRNLLDAGLTPTPKIAETAVERMSSYAARKLRR